MGAGQWRDIGDYTTQDALDAAFVAGSDGFYFEARGWKYEVDFKRMAQINQSTKQERNIRRIPQPATMDDAAAAALPAPKSPKPVGTPLVAVPAAAPLKAAPPVAPAAPAAVAPAAVAPAVAPPVAKPKRSEKPFIPGKVKAFFKERAYGFIALDDAEEVFFHVSALQVDSVKVNDVVECHISKDGSGRKRATKVNLVKRAPLMRTICRNPICQGRCDRHFEDKCPRGGFAG